MRCTSIPDRCNTQYYMEIFLSSRCERFLYISKYRNINKII